MDFDVNAFEKKARNLRKRVFEFNKETGLKHYGGSFSSIEILVALFDVVMKEEDKFILSKGHCASPYFLLLTSNFKLMLLE